jgi:predicted nucleotidyltransferase
VGTGCYRCHHAALAPRRVILFGSVARAMRDDSDIDLLVVLADLRGEEKLRLLGDLIRVGSIAPR